ncbi:DUF5605 domain-containing protein [Subtercola endophyticus]|uniref:DUF5605 domain-containing protein n=1 Tax=Subtercola endophyticus TaxID=2895559 RepID=UPI001E287711|nr:DUF5605 domain-containing protein [Subtercola endophyticus]UFS60630.1 DUF5605 domain-containing protein [Subtercola endophyticus]
MSFGPDSSLETALAVPEAKGVLAAALPGIINSPMVRQLAWMPLKYLLSMPGAPTGPALDDLWYTLDRIDGTRGEVLFETAPIEVRSDYEPETVSLASASLEHPAAVGLRGRLEIVIDGPSHGNPFVDVDLTATFVLEEGVSGASNPARIERVVGGFYDGDGRYLLRFYADRPGPWSFVISSNARSLDGLSGSFDTVDEPASKGVVRVAETFHFAHDDGSRHAPLGTTAYVWNHQPPALQEKTLQTLEAAPFNKLRMCVFPKAYLFNSNEPELFPFVGSVADGWDTTRFDTRYWQQLDRQIDALAELGIEADLILFHAYDRWGFSNLGPVADDRYVAYLVRRLHAHANVWWSLANEYDLLASKVVADWERLAGVIEANDPNHHLLSIHNCGDFYDYSRPWITHASVQRIDVYRTAENTDGWRERWGKPVVIDECAYEGDIDQGWGNITGQEMIRRFWEGAVRGGYVGHGETYLNDREELWWSKGGELIGSSPSRVAFLASVLAESPGGVLNPVKSEWDVPWAGIDGEFYLLYLGFGQSQHRNIIAPPTRSGGGYVVDVIDTWNMTIERLPGEHAGYFTVPLPARQYMAIRLTAI